MKTHDQEPGQDVNVEDGWDERAEEGAPAFSPSTRNKSNSRRVTWISLAVVVVLIGLSVSVFAFLFHRQEQSQVGGSQWSEVLSNYQVSKLIAAPGQPDTLYACALPTKANSGGVTQPSGAQSYTLLKSTDAGSRWQDLGMQAALGSTCEVVVSPTNADELYVLSSSSTTLPGSTLPFFKHSLDGGRSWQAVSPKLHGTSAAWSVSQISLVGNQLFGLQSMPQGSVPRGASGQPAINVGLVRLVKSMDGGRTWNAVATPLANQNLSVHEYQVDPSNASTLYILAGASGFPGLTPQAPQMPGLMNTELYKSTDGGANWTLLVKNLSYNAQLQIASAKPGWLFLGQSFGPVPLAATAGSDTYALPANGKAQASIQNSFNLRMSRDGGATWKDITPKDNEALSSSWLVGADGTVYRYTQSFKMPTMQGGSGSSGSSSSNPGQSTVGSTPAGQPTSGTRLSKPTTTPQLKNGVPYIPASGTPAGPVILSPPASQPTASTVPVTGDGSLQIYTPTANSWQKLTQGPDTLTGWLLAVTGQSGQQRLWLMGTYAQGDALYVINLS